MAVLPIEMVENILCRLPVKSLARFRCVSKQWSALINDSIFIQNHIIRSTNNNNYSMIVQSGKENSVYIFNNSSKGTTELEHFNKIFQWKDDTIYTSYPGVGSREVRILGSWDGLLFLGSHPLASVMWLYNPSTRKQKCLPSPAVGISNVPRTIYGFGYNAASRDYQVLRIVCYYDKRLQIYYSICEVYSLRNDSWRQIQVPPTMHGPASDLSVGVFVNGAVHWVVRHGSSESDVYGITAFNFATCEFSDLHFPDNESNQMRTTPELVVLGGRLCLIYTDSCSCYVGQMMEDYGVKESWTKLFKTKNYIPMWCGVKKEDRFLFDARNLFVYQNDLHVYNPEDKSIQLLRAWSGTTYFGASYVESLVDVRSSSFTQLHV